MRDTGMPTPLVSTDWLAANLGQPGLVVVDASWYLPTQNRNAAAEYAAGHIQGAVFWDLDALSDRAASLPHMLPLPDDLGRAAGCLGIGNEDRVVVYDGSGVNLSAARVWWMLRVAGHDEVAVLDGGLTRWRLEQRPLRVGLSPWAPRHFTIRYRPDLVRSMEETRRALEAGTAQVVDARSRGRFLGSEPEPRPGLRPGHAPGARSLPFGELVGPDGRLLAATDLRRIYAAAGVDLNGPVIASCGSGVTACAVALGLELLGHRTYAVYDGSWSEWGQPEGPAVATGPASG
jgi:thiosulfate/3-mercaptopyruvate sulfurtransferase